MSWTAAALDQLAAMSFCGYASNGPASTEPTAFAAIALTRYGRLAAARRHLAWLARHQNADGSLGVTATETEPCWPTSLALLAWSGTGLHAQYGVPMHHCVPKDSGLCELPLDSESFRTPSRRGTSSPTATGTTMLMDAPRATAATHPRETSYAREAKRALAWLLTMRGETIPRNDQFGHDVTLVGWPWVAGTHSWIEPTSFAVLALRTADSTDDPRYGEALRLLVDRQLPGGGCNYGNTVVLGNTLLPHTQPSAIALLALAGTEYESDPRVAKSLAWLHSAADSEQGTASLAFALTALAAHEEPHRRAAALLASAYQRCARRPISAYALSLLLIAADSNQ